MGFTVERSGFIRRPDIYNQIIKDLVENGFIPVYYNLGALSDPIADITATKATLIAGPSVDIMNDPSNVYPCGLQPWRIQIDGTLPGGQVIVATEYQLPDDGSCYTFTGTKIPATNTTITTDISGCIGRANEDEDGLITESTIHNANPYNYILSITNRGIAIEIFQQIAVNGARRYSWFCIQRLVNPITGKIQTTGKCPVAVLYCCEASGKHARRFYAREVDVYGPTQSQAAYVYSDYVNQVINVEKQTVLAETNQYYIIFPAGFNTNRHLYNEEMDMVAYTSAGVLSQNNDAIVNVYGRATVAFSNGSTKPLSEDLIKDPITGATGVVYEVVLTSGTWLTSTTDPITGTVTTTGGDAKGFINVYSCSGTFVTSNPIDNVTKNLTKIAVSDLDSQLEYRSYRGGCANIPDAEGMRMLYLVSGGGI
jgi:hypothetical protein